MEGPFSIAPSSGVLGIDNAGQFSVSFSPQALAVDSIRAVLMLRNVPKVAVPSDSQASLMQHLLEHGHGDHVKLRSWLKSISETVSFSGLTGFVTKDVVRLSQLVSSQQRNKNESYAVY